MKFEADIDSRRWRRDFEDFATADKIATRDTLNITAATTRKLAVGTVREEFTLRNTFTVRNIVYDQVQTNDRNKMVSKVGATTAAGYLELHHRGGIRPPDLETAYQGTAVPDLPARYSENYKKAVNTKYNKLNVVRRRLVTPRGNTKAARIAAMFVAFKKKKYVLTANAILQINEIESRNGKIKMKFKRLYAIKHDPIRIQPTNWLLKHAEVRASRIGQIYFERIRELWGNSVVI